MNIKTICLTVCIVCGSSYMLAQDSNALRYTPENNPTQLPREVPSPERNARKITTAMKKELGLTDKQYDKLYKLNLKEQKELFGTTKNQQAMVQGGPRGGGQGMGNRPPGVGGGRMGGGGSAMGIGGQPPMGGGGQRPSMDGGDGFGQGMPGNTKAVKGKTEEDMQKAAAKKDKKVKKILTADQYTKWQTMKVEYSKPMRPERSEHPGPRQEHHSGQSDPTTL